MTGFQSLTVGSLLLLSLGALSCGSSRQLQSVKIDPATASGRAQFTATGTFSEPPSPAQLTSKDVLWCMGSSDGQCVGNANPGGSVDQNGMAQCLPLFRGTAVVLAGKPIKDPSPMPDAGPKMKVFGSAELTCP